jgi:hypothetical protein
LIPTTSKQAFRRKWDGLPDSEHRTTFLGEAPTEGAFRHDRRIAFDQLTTILPCREKNLNWHWR